MDTIAVIGAGIAGLSFAIRAAAHGSVIVLTKGEALDSNTAWAQGGIAAVLKAAIPEYDFEIVVHVVLEHEGWRRAQSSALIVHHPHRDVRCAVAPGAAVALAGSSTGNVTTSRRSGAARFSRRAIGARIMSGTSRHAGRPRFSCFCAVSAARDLYAGRQMGFQGGDQLRQGIPCSAALGLVRGFLGGALGACGILGKHIRSQPVFGIVRLQQGIIFIIKLRNRYQRPKGFFIPAGHCAIDA